ncbi:MAG: ABC transporter ATP-binding protein/permease [Erysipelotrichaceae bacterium]|nr:ABC transporter ATP-binding protein/permease [Erysipelotrichaceae bacterium]
MDNEYDEINLNSKINTKVWKRLLAKMWEYKGYCLGAIIFMIFSAFCETMFVKYICSDGLSKYLNQGIDSSFYAFIVGMLLFVVCIAICTYIMLTFASFLELKFYSKITKETFAKVQNQPFSFFDKNTVGFLMARISSDTSRLGQIISWGLIDIVYAFFKLLFIFIVMGRINFKLSLIMLIIIPLVTIVAALFNKIIIKLSRKQRKVNAEITSYLNEGISAAKTSKTLLLEERKVNEFSSIVNKYKKTTMKISFAQSGFYQIIAFSSAIALALMGYFGGLSPLNSSILFLFLSYSTSFFEPVLVIARLSNEMRHAQVAAERIFNLNDVVPEILDSKEVIDKYGDYIHFKKENWEELNGDIEFENVSFKYNNGKEVLKDFNLKVKKGQSVALVGPTGAGKTTIVNLLCRFYEPTSGVIKIDGIDYKKRSVAWLHSHLGYVLQTPYLFDGTIKDNIRYGALDASDEQIYNAAKIANAESFILKLEKGYDTIVGESGNRLSLGQKQLISFARAILANPSILVLDEATSSVDTQTEYDIQQAISHILKNRTSFVIAHRLSTIVNSDIILVIDDGKIIEQGNHQQLMDKKGKYYHLYTNQFIEEKMKELNF